MWSSNRKPMIVQDLSGSNFTLRVVAAKAYRLSNQRRVLELVRQPAEPRTAFRSGLAFRTA